MTSHSLKSCRTSALPGRTWTEEYGSGQEDEERDYRVCILVETSSSLPTCQFSRWKASEEFGRGRSFMKQRFRRMFPPSRIEPLARSKT